MSASTYYINELQQNANNNNHFIYIDSVDGSLDIKNNKWFFDLNFYIIMDGSLPMNTLVTSITLPFAVVDKISLNHNPYIDIPSWVVQKNLCQVYQTSFNIETGESKYLQQNLTNYIMYMNFDFDFDSNVINKTTFNSPSSNIDMFLNEWCQLKQHMEFNFTNYLKLTDNDGWFDNGNNYYLNNRYISSKKSSVIYYSMNDKCKDLLSPLTYLLNIKVADPITIVYTNLRFSYSIGDDPKIYEYKFENNTPIYVMDRCDINFDQTTTFNPSTKQVTDSLLGNKGFFVPETCIGYYEAEIRIAQDNNLKTYCFHKSFNFVGQHYENRYINIKPIFIDEITRNFIRMEF